MIFSILLVAGTLLVMAIGAIVFVLVDCEEMLAWMIPWAPMLVMVGSFFLMLPEVILLFGGRDDRRAALRDLGYLAPTFLVSGGLWFLAQHYLW